MTHRFDRRVIVITITREHYRQMSYLTAGTRGKKANHEVTASLYNSRARTTFLANHQMAVDCRGALLDQTARQAHYLIAGETAMTHGGVDGICNEINGDSNRHEKSPDDNARVDERKILP